MVFLDCKKERVVFLHDKKRDYRAYTVDTKKVVTDIKNKKRVTRRLFENVFGCMGFKDSLHEFRFADGRVRLVIESSSALDASLYNRCIKQDKDSVKNFKTGSQRDRELSRIVIVFSYDPSALVNSLSSPSFRSDTTQKDMPARVQ